MRYYPKIDWSELSPKKSLTAYIFRFYEMIFGRNQNIRAESFAGFAKINGKVSVVYQYCSLESIICHFEQVIRNIFKFKFPVKVWIPQLSSPMGLPMPQSPFMFAIAYGTSTGAAKGSATQPLTISFTATGSNSLIMVGGVVVGTGGTGLKHFDTFTWNGNNMTFQYHYFPALVADLQRDNAFASYLNGTADGNAHDVVLPMNTNPDNDIYGVVGSYSGVLQSGFPDNKNKTDIPYPTDASTIATAVTTIADNCWVVGYGCDGTNATAGTATTLRNNTVTNSVLCDNNGPKTPAGSVTLTLNLSPSIGIYFSLMAVSIAPAAPAVVNGNFLTFF